MVNHLKKCYLNVIKKNLIYKIELKQKSHNKVQTVGLSSASKELVIERTFI